MPAIAVSAIRMRCPRRSLLEAQSTASPAIRTTIQPAPIVGQVLARERRTMIATAASPRPTSGQGWSRRSASTSAAIDCLPSAGHDEDGGQVDEDPRAAEQREDDEPEPEDGRVEVEVASEAAADAGDPFVVRAALEPLDLWVCVMCSLMSRGCLRTGPVAIRHHPGPTLNATLVLQWERS